MHCVLYYNQCGQEGESTGGLHYAIWRLQKNSCKNGSYVQTNTKICLCTDGLFCKTMLPLLKVVCPKILEIRNPWGKVLKEEVSDLKTFTNKRCKIAAHKKSFFFVNFAFKVLYIKFVFWGIP